MSSRSQVWDMAGQCVAVRESHLAAVNEEVMASIVNGDPTACANQVLDMSDGALSLTCFTSVRSLRSVMVMVTMLSSSINDTLCHVQC